MRNSGIHHVTAIARAARRNLDFFTTVLGLRLVKKTVNFDDPGAYHFYYGNELGQPGTIITFFLWEHPVAGRMGLGQTQETAFRVPQHAIGYWTRRFIAKSVAHHAIEERFSDTVLPFQDPDGMQLALVATAGADSDSAWTGSDVPAEHAIRGFHGVTLLLEVAEPSGAIITDVFGFTETGREGSRIRYRAAGVTPGGIVDIRAAGGFLPGRQGGGSVHHVAFRARDDTEQADMVRKLLDTHDIASTEQKDRNYFRSVYFREPGGILFEIATDQPGFTTDEPGASLGQSLKLPHFLETRRSSIEAALPKVT
jgi:glyoxalase family protein